MMRVQWSCCEDYLCDGMFKINGIPGGLLGLRSMKRRVFFFLISYKELLQQFHLCGCQVGFRLLVLFGWFHSP